MKKFLLTLTAVLLLGTIVFLQRIPVMAGVLDRETSNSTTYLPLIFKNYASDGTGYGNLSGVVRDIRSKNPLPDIDVCLEDTTFCAVTNLDGEYNFYHISNGIYTVLATDSGGDYLSASEPVTILPNGTTTQVIDLFPLLADEDVRVVVTWDANASWVCGSQVCPNDMNLHLWIDDGAGNIREINIGDTGNCADLELEPQACYESNEQYGSGPDVLVFKALTDIYSLAVLNYYYGYPDVPSFRDMLQRGTPARVQVYKGSNILFDDVVTNASGGDGDLWYILKYDTDPVEQNCTTSYTAGSPPPDDCVAQTTKK